MEKAGKYLGQAVRMLHQPRAVIAWLQSNWPRIVGGTLAEHTRPTRCENGELEISADAKEWQHHIEALKREMCERVNNDWGRPLVREIVCHIRKPLVQGIPHELDLNHTPFVRRRKA